VGGLFQVYFVWLRLRMCGWLDAFPRALKKFRAYMVGRRCSAAQIMGKAAALPYRGAAGFTKP
jgi:hypothetical protein